MFVGKSIPKRKKITQAFDMSQHPKKVFDPMQCQSCRSRNTATFEMVQLRQTRTGGYSGSGIGFNGNVMIDSGRFSSQSRLAQMIALPGYPNFWNGKMWIGTILAFFLMLVNFIAGQIFVLKNPQLAEVSPFGIDPYYLAVKNIPPLSSLIVFFGLIFFFGYFRS